MDRLLVETFKALSDQNRLRILALLRREPLFVGEISRALHLAFSTASQHLAILRDAGFIIDAKAGRWVKYALDQRSSNLYARSMLNLLEQWIGEENSFKLVIASLLKKRPAIRC